MFSENEVLAPNQLGGRRASGTEGGVCSSVKKNVNSVLLARLGKYGTYLPTYRQDNR